MNQLWAIRGFLKGLNTSELGNDDISPSDRKVILTKSQYEELLKFVDEAIKATEPPTYPYPKQGKY